jgi:hypothetical protein
MTRINKHILTILLSVFILNYCCAQSRDSLMVQLSRKWVHSKAYALKMAELMPEQNYNFKPVPAEMSFKEQLLHIADNMQWLSSSYLFVTIPKAKIDTAHLTKAAVLKILSDAYDAGLLAHQQLSVAQLDEKVKFFAGPMTRRQILGQLIVYLRLKGVQPPEYIGW